MTENTHDMTPAIELRGITKRFGSVTANDGIDLTLYRGEILALLGENGSGKTTLMNMLSGIYRPDGGTIRIFGREAHINSPEDAKALGIGMIHQHFKLVDVMSAADNILLGAGDCPFFMTGNRCRRINEISRRYGLEIRPERMVHEMSVSEKQTLEILKVLYYNANILILDEPTAVLTPQETQRLFAILRTMRDGGCAIIIITHKLHEVLEISDRVTVLHKGRSVDTVRTADTDAARLTELMVGHKVELSIERPPVKPGRNLLHVHHLTIASTDVNAPGVDAVSDLSFDLAEGEILGVAGVAGSGQKELCEAIAGLQKIKKGAILYQDENIEGKTPREIIKLGISMSFIPEDRLGMGLAASLSVADNMMLKNYRTAPGPFVDRKSAAGLAEKLVGELEIATPSVDTPVRRLSGGNVQKVLIGREIDADPRVLITAYAVRGLDIHSSYTIYELLNRQKKKGAGVLFIGEDLDVMLGLCDRIMVMCHGRCTGIVNANAVSKEQLGLMMTGALDMNAIQTAARSDDDDEEALVK